MNLAGQLFVAVFILLASRMALSHAMPPPVPVGQVIESVACMDDSSESYAAYLPSNYTAAKRWPIVYAFDPMARGRIPVSLYKEVAEEYGYILVASNNSRNFSLESPSKAANAMWQDTHLRFSLDPRRIYTTGFSGGARIAGRVAMGCSQCRIAGVIAFGAGYSNPGKSSDSLLYFFGVGDQDFNWPEIIQIRHEREDAGQPYRVQVFPGQHQWGPPAVMDDAIQWMQLKALQAGAAPQDAPFIDQAFRKRKLEAADAAQTRDAIAQLNAYRSLVSDFAGLKDVSAETKEIAALKQSAALKSALKREDDEISQQAALTHDLFSKIALLGPASVEQRLALRTDILHGMTDLKQRADSAKNQEQRLVLLRAQASLWVSAIESGQAQLRQKAWSSALEYFQLVSEGSPDEPWPCLLMAETRTAMGDKKQAIKHLREAVRRGLKNPEALEKDDALEPLRNEAEYQKLLAEMKAK